MSRPTLTHVLAVVARAQSALYKTIFLSCPCICLSKNPFEQSLHTSSSSFFFSSRSPTFLISTENERFLLKNSTKPNKGYFFFLFSFFFVLHSIFFSLTGTHLPVSEARAFAPGSNKGEHRKRAGERKGNKEGLMFGVRRRLGSERRQEGMPLHFQAQTTGARGKSGGEMGGKENM